MDFKSVLVHLPLEPWPRGVFLHLLSLVEIQVPTEENVYLKKANLETNF